METSVTPKQIVLAYIEAYNRFDVDGMVANLHDEVVFRNIANGEVTLKTTGKESFRQQAERAKRSFSQREQCVTSWQISANQVEVLIDYTGVAAVNFPSGLKPGDTVQLWGKSIFKFDDSQITSIDDIIISFGNLF